MTLLLTLFASIYLLLAVFLWMLWRISMEIVEIGKHVRELEHRGGDGSA